MPRTAAKESERKTTKTGSAGQARKAKETKPKSKETKVTRKRKTFTLDSPHARQVEVAGDFTDWKPVEMKKNTKGRWQKVIPLDPGRHEYRFIVDGEWIDDPGCPDRVKNDVGGQNCVVKV